MNNDKRKVLRNTILLKHLTDKNTLYKKLVDHFGPRAKAEGASFDDIRMFGYFSGKCDVCREIIAYVLNKGQESEDDDADDI
jgi:hypothetical protein